MARRKKQKALNYNGEDIISNLPDAILCHILSFLPTKEAAQTSLLSKRWEYLWTQITRLEFHDNAAETETEKRRFLELVNRILQRQILTSSVHSFTLWFSIPNAQYPEDLSALIFRVLEQKVQKLSIKQTSLSWLYNIKRLSIFPSEVFNTTSLTELDISVPTTLRFPSSNCLTNLKVLRFWNIDFFGDCIFSSKELRFSFPVLKVFEIDLCKFLDVNGLIIDTPMLESFVVKFPLFKGRLEKEWLRDSVTIKLFALDLRKFFYSSDVEIDMILSNPLTVVDVFLNVRVADPKKERICVQAGMLLKEFHESVEFLELGPFMIQTIERLKDDSLLRLPIFKRLVSLVLAFASDVSIMLLQKSPNLQRLEVKAIFSTYGKTLFCSKDVLRCIQRNLKVVKIVGSEWDENKFRFTKDVLENAQVLDLLSISLLKAGVRNVTKQLKSIPKASRSVQTKVKRLTLKESSELLYKYNYNILS